LEAANGANPPSENTSTLNLPVLQTLAGYTQRVDREPFYNVVSIQGIQELDKMLVLTDGYNLQFLEQPALPREIWQEYHLIEKMTGQALGIPSEYVEGDATRFSSNEEILNDRLFATLCEWTQFIERLMNTWLEDTIEGLAQKCEIDRRNLGRYEVRWMCPKHRGNQCTSMSMNMRFRSGALTATNPHDSFKFISSLDESSASSSQNPLKESKPVQNKVNFKHRLEPGSDNENDQDESKETPLVSQAADSNVAAPATGEDISLRINNEFAFSDS
jgi:hypothetical protein